MKVRRRGRSLPPSPPTEGWKPGELELRRREVAIAERTTRSQKWVQLAQVLSVVVALFSTLVALLSARQSNQATQAAAQASRQQTAESQLTSAISSLGVGNSTARTARILLIERDIRGIMSLPLSSSGESQDAYSDFETTFGALSVYISSYTGANTLTFGRGYGIPSRGVPLDITYAADALHQLLSMGSRVREVASTLNTGQPAIDLSNDELIGQPWVGVDFSWIFAYMVGIDLRGADLATSHWSQHADLSHSYLQCADLEGADFRGANLTYADLRGANVQGADFRGAHIAGARTTALYGNAKWPPGAQDITTLPINEWNQGECLRNVSYWDNRPTSVPVRSSLSSSSSSSTSRTSIGKGK
jgi:hypothetical protein